MKTLLLFDSWAPISHRTLNNHLIGILSKSYKLKVVNIKKYYMVQSPNIEYIDIPIHLNEGKSGFSKRIAFFVNFFISRISIIKSKYDSMLIMTYHSLFFSSQFPFLPKEKDIFLFEHYNIDSLTNNRFLKNYLKYANKTHHIVFAPYMGKYLAEIGVDEKKIHSIHHPLLEPAKPRLLKKERIMVYAPGQSNDSSFIRNLIYKEVYTHFLRNNNIFIKYRCSEKFEGVPENIELFSGYLTDDQYVKNFDESDVILVFYPQSFKYRLSSVIINAMSRGKVVFGNDILIVKYFEKQYPHNCRSFSNIEDFIRLLSKNAVLNIQEYDSFVKDFSDSVINREFVNFI